METVAHGIGVKNRYALFYDDDLDPLEIIRKQEEEKLKRKTDKTQVKDKSKVTKSIKPSVTTTSPKKPLEPAATKTAKVTENVETFNKPKGKPQTDRYQRSYGNSQESKDFEDRKNIRNKDDQYFNAEHKERDSEFRRGRGGFRGRGGRDRGRGVFGNPEARNRRMFDRHSGSDKTGVRPTDKRDGAGSNNWGDIRSDINQRKDDMWDEEFDASAEKPRETTNWPEEESTEKKEDVGNPAETDNAEAKENEPLPEEPIEESVKEMTLDEWKREQEAKRVVPKYNLRKPGEGEDDKQWKKGYVLKKKAKEDDDDDEQDEDDEDDDDYNRKGGHRQLLDIQINFSDSRRGTRGRGRGGRGGPPRASGPDGPRADRGGIRGGRGGNREPSKMKGQQSAPRVDDFNDFPSLVNA